MRRERGFTLIELLTVVAIIGLLSAVAVAAINSAREKQRCLEGMGLPKDDCRVTRKGTGEKDECAQYGYRSADDVPVMCLEYYGIDPNLRSKVTE